MRNSTRQKGGQTPETRPRHRVSETEPRERGRRAETGKMIEVTSFTMDELKKVFNDHYAPIAVLTTAGMGLVLLRRWMSGGVCRSLARMDGKTVVITGANTGIGKETAVDLARRGARVVLACRDEGKAQAAADEVRQRSGNSDVVVERLDLASLASVREFSRRLHDTEKRLDVLVNNAGLMRCPKWKTEDGFEMQFGVNHLGHFLLTNLVLDMLQKSAPSRVINVSSLAHTRGKIHFDDINLDQNYNPGTSYNQSKLANVLFTRELARRLQGTGVTVNSLHPGVVKTEVGRHVLDGVAAWKCAMLYPLVLLLLKTPPQGAQTSIYCAVAEELEDVSGLYFSDCAPKDVAPQGKDDDTARRLWELSARMVGMETDGK
ncbi:retinol dehydrogenase 13-like isoform X1 [Lethenteron reissneri]|uniref:retinol dehydrogenase 13-like isoform X1 n=2 Tax=Lethenteron reissneri TaxID=7753 RepID=UPI002AB7658C|nr:retinol dehydrogenase 13-like isoform X1 [Lethenteron reissneri]